MLLAVCVLCSAYGSALAEEESKEDADELGEGRIWVPKLAFPASDPTAPAGYLPLWNRDISIEYLKYTFYLSLAKGLEVIKKESDFYLRLGSRRDLPCGNDGCGNGPNAPLLSEGLSSGSLLVSSQNWL